MPDRAGNVRSNSEEHCGQQITIHCTVTGQMMKRPGYLKEFLEYWTPRARSAKYGSACSLRKWETGCRKCCNRMSGAGHYRDACIKEAISQAGHAGGDDSAVRNLQVVQGLCFCAHYANIVGGPENQDRPLSIRRKSGLWFVRMRGIHGLGSRGSAHLGGIIPVGPILKLSQIGQARSKWTAQMPPVEKGLRVLP